MRRFTALPLLGAAAVGGLLVAGCTRVGDMSMPGPIPQVEQDPSTVEVATAVPAGTSISLSSPPPGGVTVAELLARMAAGEPAAPAPEAVGAGADLPPPAPAQEVLRMVEDLRRAAGLPPLDVDDRLVAAARQQALGMAGAGELSHQDLTDELDGGWDLVGENVGYGPNAAAIFDALVRSEGHHANLVHARFTHIGIAVVIDDAGRLWVSQVFGG